MGSYVKEKSIIFSIGTCKQKGLSLLQLIKLPNGLHLADAKKLQIVSGQGHTKAIAKFVPTWHSLRDREQPHTVDHML